MRRGARWSVGPRLACVAVAVALGAAACGGEDSTSGLGDAGTTTSPSGDAGTTTSPSEPRPTTTTTALPGGQLVRCSNEHGFSIAHPESWHVNDGSVVSACSQFHPDPFQVPAGTDERVAAVTAYIERVPFPRAVLSPGPSAERWATVVDGFQAVRMSYRAGDDGLHRPGTPITVYLVDLVIGVDEDPATLFIDTVGIPGFDYESNVVVLDRMARTVEIPGDGAPERSDVVARYEGGGGAFTVVGALRGSQACLRIPPRGEPVCTEVPGDDELSTVQLTDLEPILAGVVGGDVFGVTAERRDGDPSTVLPAPIPNSHVRGFAFTLDLDAVERIRLFDVVGNELRVVRPGG